MALNDDRPNTQVAGGVLEASKARKGAPSPNPAALHPHRAESSGAKSNHGPTSMLRSPRQPHTQIRAAAPTAAPQRPTQRSSAPIAAPPTPHQHLHAPHRPPRACTLPITTTTTTTGHVKHMANLGHFLTPLGAHLNTTHACRAARGAEGAREGTLHTPGNASSRARRPRTGLACLDTYDTNTGGVLG